MAPRKVKGHDKIKTVMEEFKEGTLKSGRTHKKVTDRQQALAIALSEQRKKDDSEKAPKKKRTHRSKAHPRKKTTTKSGRAKPKK